MPIDTERIEIFENKIKGIMKHRTLSDKALNEYIPPEIEGVFNKLNDWIDNECQDLCEYIDILYSECGAPTTAILDNFKQNDIESIRQEKSIISSGIIGQVAQNSILRTQYILEISDRIHRLIPLAAKLENIRQKLDSVHTDLSLR